jgi:hypothetical protein
MWQQKYLFITNKYFCSDTQYTSCKVLWPLVQRVLDSTPLKVIKNMVEKLQSPVKFKYVRTNAGGLLSGRGSWQHHLHKQCVKCSTAKNVCILSDRGGWFLTHPRSRNVIFPVRSLRNAVFYDTLWAFPITPSLDQRSLYTLFHEKVQLLMVWWLINPLRPISYARLTISLFYDRCRGARYDR